MRRERAAIPGKRGGGCCCCNRGVAAAFILYLLLCLDPLLQATRAISPSQKCSGNAGSDFFRSYIYLARDASTNSAVALSNKMYTFLDFELFS
jgi:hypothetical protein